MKILAINPGSTSTKIALFEDDNLLFKQTIQHELEDLKQFATINDQKDYRKNMILDFLRAQNCSIEDIAIYAVRGGGQAAQESGSYFVNELMVKEAVEEKHASHPALLGPQIAYEFQTQTGHPAIMVNAPSTDEMKQVARLTGIKGIYRLSYCHTLNQKEIAKRYAKSVNKSYEELNLIVAHIGGGISIAAHEKGRIIDTNDILNGDGPMTPTRTGSIPAKDIVELAFSGIEKKELLKLIRSEGGFLNHLGTHDVLEIKERIDSGDIYAKNVYDGMIYQIAKAIGSMYVALKAQTDAILITGGIAHDSYLVDKVSSYVGNLAPISVFAGEFELEALAQGAREDYLAQTVKDYDGIPYWNEARLYDTYNEE